MMTYDGHPEREFEFVQRLTIEVRRLRHESGMKNSEEIQLLHKGDCPMTDGGRQLLKKLANAVVIETAEDLKGKGKLIRVDN